MNLLLGVLGLGTLILIGIILANGEFLFAMVPIAAVLTFSGIWLYKRRFGPGEWEGRPTKVSRVVKLGIGLALFLISLVGIGLDLRTLFEEQMGWISTDIPDLPGNLFGSILICCVGLALLGFEKIGGVIFMGTFLSVSLSGSVAYLLLDSGNASHPSWFPAAEMLTYLVAFLAVFGLGWLFRWSKGFLLAGLLTLIALSLGAYLTM